MTYPVIKLRGSYSPALSLTNATVKDAPLTSLELDTNFYNISSLMETLAPKIAPTFTGNATVENPALSSNTTRIANTYFVNQKLTDYTPTATLTTQLSAKADLAGPTFTGTPLGPTASAGTNTTQLATTAFVDASFATKASPTFTGSVNLTGATTTAATPADSSDNQTVATTAHVKNVLTDYGLSTNTTLSTAYAAKAGATFTGVLRAPTPVDSSGNPDYTDHSTKVATTEWINGRFDNKADINDETFTGTTTLFNATVSNALVLSTTPANTGLTTVTTVPNIAWVNTRLQSFSIKSAAETLYNKTISNLTGTNTVDFSGATSVTAPTPVDSSGNPDYTDHSTKVATTEWINGRFDNKADVNNETLINPTISNATATGSLTLSSTPLQTETDVQKVPNISWVNSKLSGQLSGYVTPTGSATLTNKSLTSPTFTGSPLYQVTIPTSTADATIANTQFVDTNFLRKTDAASQYLTQSDASTTYSAKSGAIYSGTHNFNTASSVTVPTLATSATGQNVASVDWVRDYTTPLFDAKAPLAAPTLSGTVTLSSAIPSSQADTRAVHANWVRGFVNPLVDLKANKDSAVFTTSVTLPANFPATDSNGQDAASTNWVRSYTSPLFDEKANLAGGAAFSGTVTAPTATKNDDTIKLATTSFVQNEFSQMNKNLIPKAMTSGDIQYSGEQFIANKGYLRNPAGFSPSTGRPQYTYRGKNIGGPNEYWANLYVGEIHVSDASIRMGDGDSQAVLQSTNTGGLVLPGEVALGGEGNTIPTNLASTEMDKAYASTTRPSVLKINFTVDSGATIPYENGTYPVFLNANGNIDFMISRAGIGDAYKNFVGFVDHSGTVVGQTLEVQVQGLLAANFSGAAVYSIPFADTVASNASANEALTFSFGGATAIVDLYDESGSAPRYTGLSDATLLTELNAQLTAQSIPFTATITSDNSGFTFTHSTVGAVATPTSAITGLATFTDTAGSFITNPATTYTIVSTGGTVTDTAGSFATSDEYTIVSVGTATDTAGAFTTSTEYTIVSVGTTDFTTIGAADNTVGTVFTATGTGTGTGTASRISTDFTTIGAADNNIGTVFTATGVGSGTGTATRLSTNFKLIGAANNTIGTTFTATGVGSGAGTASRIGTTSVSIIVSTVTNGSSFTAGNEVHINSTGDFLTAAGSSTAKIGKAVSISQLFLYSINTIPEYVQSQVKVDLNSFSVNPSATPSGPGSLAYNNTNGQLTFTPPKQIADADLTGTPTVPTATAGTDTTQAASTAFVKAAIDALVAAAPETLDTLNEIAAAINNEGNFAATVARLASPTFTGTVTVPEPAAASDNQTVATTAFVRSTAPSLVDAALAGVPTAPTAALHTETTQIATTEFVATAIARGGGSSNLDGGLANTTRTLATHHFDGGNAS